MNLARPHDLRQNCSQRDGPTRRHWVEDARAELPLAQALVDGIRQLTGLRSGIEADRPDGKIAGAIGRGVVHCCTPTAPPP